MTAPSIPPARVVFTAEDRRRIDSTREGMIEGFSLGSYLLLVDYTARLFREGKATLSREMAEILDRLHTSAEQWHARLDRLRTGRPLGRFFAATRARLREIGTRRPHQFFAADLPGFKLSRRHRRQHALVAVGMHNFGAQEA